MRFALVAALVPLLGFSLISGKQSQYLLPEFAAFALLAAFALDAAPATRVQRWPLAVPAAALGLAGLATALFSASVVRSMGAHEHRLLVVAVGAFVVLAAATLLWRPPADAAGQARRLAFAMVAAMCAAQLASPALLREAYDLHPVSERIRALQEADVPVANVGKYHGQFHFPGRLRRPIEVVPEGGFDAWLAAHPEGRAVVYFRGETYRGPGEVEYTQAYRGQRLAIVSSGRR